MRRRKRDSSLLIDMGTKFKRVIAKLNKEATLVRELMEAKFNEKLKHITEKRKIQKEEREKMTCDMPVAPGLGKYQDQYPELHVYNTREHNEMLEKENDNRE